MVVGVLGCIVPMIPGPPIAYLGMLCFQLTEMYTFTTGALITWGVVVALSVLIFFCMIRAVKGPRFTDRVMAGNMIGTIVIVILSVLSVAMDAAYLVDVAIVYAMLSFITVVVLCRLVIVRRRVHEREEQEQNERR